jgi:hypothetical protein
MDMTVRRTEPGDYEAMQRIFGGSPAVAGTMQMPLPSAERWRRLLAEPQEGLFSLGSASSARWLGASASRPPPATPWPGL